MVPNLLRIGDRESIERRLCLASPDRDGRLLPEQPAANVVRLARAASAALASGSEFIHGAARGAASGATAVSAQAVQNYLLLHSDAVPDRHHSHRQLHLPQLPCTGPRLSATGR